jgi:hypothetical protein
MERLARDEPDRAPHEPREPLAQEPDTHDV